MRCGGAGRGGLREEDGVGRGVEASAAGDEAPGEGMARGKRRAVVVTGAASDVEAAGGMRAVRGWVERHMFPLCSWEC